MRPTVRVLDPLADGRWDRLVAQHPRATVFHSRGWLEALKLTYAYQPRVLTTTAAGPLDNGVAVCEISTWMSRRMVSLPFSDHCDPLVDTTDDLATILAYASRHIDERDCRSVELRPRDPQRVRMLADASARAALDTRRSATRFAEARSYYLHTLDLARPASLILGGFHRSSTRGAIRRAEREGLGYEAGTAEPLLHAFYGLLRLTRRRHGLPPQPIDWFRNLLTCLGDVVTIHVAYKDDQPIAAILTLTFKDRMVYKYSGSDPRYHRLGAVPFLLWRAIERARQNGVAELDLGRSDVDQDGLVAFKDRFGATRTTLTYYRCPEQKPAARRGVVSRAAHRIIRHLPDAALDMTGRLLYRHMA